MDAPPVTPELKDIVRRAEARRIALMGDMAAYRMRIEETMRWLNPPWDPISRRVDPRPELASARRDGEARLHIDLAGPTVTRWAALEVGTAPILRVKPLYVRPPVQHPDDPDKTIYERQQYELDRQLAQNQSSQMENQTGEWMEANNFHRTLLWAAWSKEAFSKAVLKTGWSPTDQMPSIELMENPSQVYYGWTKRYGQRRLSWVLVVSEMAPEEAEVRFGLRFPRTETGAVDFGQWTASLDTGELDVRVEQSQQVDRYVVAEEYHELVDGGARGSRYALIIAGRVVEGPYTYPWKRLPFHILENEHIPTYGHGKGVAESIIPINDAYDDMLDRQHQVIRFESGPRYKGLNMKNNADDVEMPAPFEYIPLGDGQDIQQIDTRVDFFPTQLHAQELRDAKYKATGLTPIAWGMSPNAQTSGRAMSAEWRAVELPLAARLIEMAPVIKDIVSSWWDYAEEYTPDAKQVSKGYRRFQILWVPLDIRDRTEKTLDIIQRLQANIIDPETAIEETGYENVDEIVARIRSYLVDPVWNPLRYQQYLTLQQLELAIRQSMLQVQAMEQQAQSAGGAPAGQSLPPGQPAPADLAAQGANAAGAAAQGPSGPVTTAQNQPGMSPGGGGLPIETSILSQTPLQGGIGNRAMVGLTPGPAPSNGQQPR